MSITTSGDTDAALWTRVQRDDHAAFETVYRRHWQSVTRHLSRRVAAADVEDLVATVFLEAWRQRARLEVRDGRGLLPWLYTVSRNVAAGHLKRNRLERPTAPASMRAESIADHAGVLADEAEHAWRLAMAQAALASLNHSDQEILDLCLTDGLTPAEAARILDISAVTARSRLHRARGRLASAFAQRTHTGGDL